MDKDLLDSICFHLERQREDFISDYDIISQFYLYQQRLIIPMIRQVYKSKEFNTSFNTLSRADKEYVRQLIKRIEKGEDLTPYLSGKIKTEKLDKLLLDWAIYHLHYKPLPERTTLLIFCCFTKENAYLIDIKPHKNSFSDLQLLKIIDNNWNNLKYTYKDVEGNTLTNEQIYALRTNGCNTTYNVNGKCVLGPGLGQMGSNMSLMSFYNSKYLKYHSSQSNYIIHPSCLWILQDKNDRNNIIDSFKLHPSITSFLNHNSK